MVNKCQVCGVEFESKKVAKTCSARCRKVLSHQTSVTPNVTLGEHDVTPELMFKFTIRQFPGSVRGDGDWNENKARIREAKYWYDVPLAAVPVLHKDWPQVPEFADGPMNGRQYFLWWKNDFDMRDGVPVIYDPFPERQNIQYFKAGNESRRWGA